MTIDVPSIPSLLEQLRASQQALTEELLLTVKQV